jgi:hypothetical protein
MIAPHTKNTMLETNLLSSFENCGLVKIAMNLVRKTDSAGIAGSKEITNWKE